MRSLSIWSIGLGTVGVVVAAAVPASGVVLQLDFGAAPYSGTQSPAHATGDATAGEATWNTITADTPSGLVWGDNTPATGVAVQLGVGFDVNYADAWTFPNSIPSTWTEGTAEPAGPFYDTTLARDYIYNGNGVGARISGLPAGTYGVYAVGLVTVRPGDINDIGIGVNPGTSQFGVIAGKTQSDSFTAWQLGTPTIPGNYAYSEVTISGPSDYIGVIATNGAVVNSPMINAIQIVPVPLPEPAAMGLLAMAGLTLARRPRRSKSSDKSR